MLLTLIITFMLVIASIFYSSQRNLLIALSGASFGAFLTSISATSFVAKSTPLLPLALFILGFFVALITIIIHVKLCKPVKVLKSWYKRKSIKKYEHYCENFIESAKRGDIVRLMSTGGDGLAVLEESIPSHIMKVFERSCTVRVILSSPKSKRVTCFKKQIEDKNPLYSDKLAETRKKDDYLSQKLQKRIDGLRHWHDQLKVKKLDKFLEVRTIDDFPVANFIDNGMRSIFSLQTIESKGEESPIFLLDNKCAFRNFLIDHFDYIFDSTHELSENALNTIDSNSNINGDNPKK